MLIALGAAGCRAPKQAADLRIEPSSTDPCAIAADDLSPTSSSASRWQFVDCSGIAVGSPFVLDPATRSPLMTDAWLVRTTEGEVQLIRRETTGARALMETQSPEDDARTQFDPPLVAAPTSLAPGQPVSSRATMRVGWISRKGTRERGECEFTLLIEGSSRITTPAGTFDTVAVGQHFNATLGATRVIHYATAWVVPGAGAIAHRWTERISVFGVPVREVCAGAVRLDATGIASK